ncbi:endonuclease/exonuclease/phosphatase family protein [Thalassiella azotivora]
MSAGAPGGRVLGAALAVVVGGAAVVTLLRWVDVGSPVVVPALQSLSPVAGVVAAVVLVVTLLTQRWGLAAVAGGVSALQLAIAAPHVLPSTVDAGPDDVVVVAANLQQGQADTDALADVVYEDGVDVLVLTEVTPQVVTALDGAGLDALLPHRAGTPAEGVMGTMVLSSFPLVVEAPIEATFHQPVVQVESPSGTFTVAAVHAAAPTTSAWRDDLDRVAAWRDGKEGPLVVAGDFNAGSYHPGYREVSRGMTDAHEAAGSGWVRTWPTSWGLVPAWAHLDHVLVQDLDVVSAGQVDLPGSDHAAVWARLAP